MAIDAGYRGDDLESINVVRKSLHLIHVSDLVLCDGKTLDLSLTEGDLKTPLDSTVTFPVRGETQQKGQEFVAHIHQHTGKQLPAPGLPIGQLHLKPTHKDVLEVR